MKDSKKIKVKGEVLVKRKSELEALMQKLDETMLDYHKSYSNYERIFISQKILEDIASYHQSSKNKGVKEQIKKIRYSVYLKRKLYESALREYNSSGKKILEKNVRNFFLFLNLVRNAS